MALQSKYTNQQVESLVEAVLTQLAEQQAPLDLQLMVLGDAVANLITQRISPEQQQLIAKQFGDALSKSVTY